MQETEALYTLDSSIKAFESNVVAAEGDEVALRHTAFYPGGGGQPADEGTFSAGDERWQVTAVRKAEGVIWHKLVGATMPTVGQMLLGELDWARRYLLMRTHTALHIMSAIAYTDYGAMVTGGNMEPGEGRLDFEFSNWTPEVAEQIVLKANREVEENREIRVYSLPRDEALQLPDLVRTKTFLVPVGVSHIRIVELVGLDRQADGGTHVAWTAEVGTISLRGTRSKGANNKRIMIGLDA